MSRDLSIGVTIPTPSFARNGGRLWCLRTCFILNLALCRFWSWRSLKAQNEKQTQQVRKSRKATTGKPCAALGGGGGGHSHANPDLIV